MSLKIRTILTTFAIAAVLTSVAIVPSAKANVYATNIKLNGKLTNAAGFPGNNLTVSYLLNEPATRGVVVNILSSNNAVRTISLAPGTAGTLKGTNSVIWDGKNNSGGVPAGGTYNISITASAIGFTNWTQTSTDTNAGYYVFSPRGMAVNTNPASLYYGRVFVGNAQNNFSGNAPGDVDGILKLNADGSLADEGQSSAGYSWIDDGFNDSPHYLRYGQDDRIYALDFTSSGEIIACDMLMSTNQKVLSMNNYANNNAYGLAGWGMMDVTDAGTPNGRLWLGDDDESGAGIYVWHMTNGVANPNDTTGSPVIAVGGDLSDEPSGGFMMDTKSNIFVSQLRTDPGDLIERTMEFTNWNGVTPITNGTAWQVGAGDDTLRYIYDTVLNTRVNPAYVALPMSLASGGIRVLYASNGVVVTNATGTQSLTNLDAPNFYFGAAWDAVGNLYGASSSLHKWRVFSPPGTNQSTTVAVETFQALPFFTSINITNTSITLRFNGLATDAPSAYTLQSSTNVIGPYANVNGAVITQVSPGFFKATTITSGSTLFFRLKR